MSDETTTGHQRRSAIAYPNGRRMAGREVEICYQCGELWPCETVRLRERVAALEAALRTCSDVLVRVQNFRVAAPGEPFGARHPFSGAVGVNPSERALRESPDYYETTDSILVACLRADGEARAALAQVDAGGAE